MGIKKKNLPKNYLLLIDVSCIIISYILATWIRFGNIKANLLDTDIYRWGLFIVIALYITVFYIYDTFTNFFKRGFLEEILIVVKKNALLAITLTVVMFLFQQGDIFSRMFFILFFIINIMITYTARQYFKIIYMAACKNSKECTKIMIITTSDQAMNVLERVREDNEWAYQITYFTIIDRYMVGKQIKGIEVKADFINMFEVAKKEVIDEVFIHIPNTWLDLELEETVLAFQNMGITTNLSINTFGLKISEKIVRLMSGYHVLTFSSKLFDETQLQLKRLFDIVGGLVGSILTIILTIFIAPAILIESRGPVFFSQTRIGRNGRRFRIYKFRSMYRDAEQRLAELSDDNEIDGYMFKMKDDPRITKVGKFLRKTSLDEFPQFFNVLKGDMSLVGTRPPTEKEFLNYEGRHKRRLALKSGVTGMWQVSGRSNIDNFEDVVKLDLEYIDNWSIYMDVKILFKTVAVVLFGKGAK